MTLNTPLRRMFGIPGSTSAHGPVSVGAQPGPGPSVAAPSVPGVVPPPGKGVFIRSLERHVGSPKDLVDKAKWAGLTWCPILTVWQFDKQPPADSGAEAVGGSSEIPPFFQKAFNQDIAQYVAALQEAGIQAWLWGFPLARPDAVEVFSQIVGSVAAATGAAGIIIDPEGSWRTRGTETMAANLAMGLRQHSGGRPVGFTSYGAPQFHQELAWQVFGQVSDFGCPQVYDSKGDYGPGYQADGVKAYQEMGFRGVVPVLGAWGASGDTRELMLETFKRTPLPNNSSVLWWDWHNANEKQGRWDAIREAPVAVPMPAQPPQPGQQVPQVAAAPSMAIPDAHQDPRT